MLTIRQAQLDAFTQQMRADFLARMKLHLRASFAEECSAIGDTKLTDLIESGMVKAAVHGIEIEAGVAKYLTLMLAFGPDFEKDPKHTWARHVLTDPEIDDPALKAEMLYDAALEFTRIEEGITDDD